MSLYWAKVLGPALGAFWLEQTVYDGIRYTYILSTAYQGLEDKKSGLSEWLAQDHI